MNPSISNSELKKQRIYLLLGLTTSLVLAILLPLAIVVYEGIVWGGEGLFSIMIISPVLCPILALTGIGTCLAAYKTEDKAKRARIIKYGSIAYLVIIIIVFVAASALFYDSLGPLT